MSLLHTNTNKTTPDLGYEIEVSEWNQAHVQNLTLAGNTLGASTFSGTNLVLAGGPNVTLSLNGSTLSFSGGAGAAGNTGYLSAGTTNASLGTVSFANSNGITWGVDGQTLTATVKTDYLTSQSNQALSGSNGSFGFQTATFGALNGLSFYTSNGSMVGSYTVPTQTVQPVALSGSNGSFTFSTATFGASNGLSFYTTNGSLVGSYTVPTQSVQTQGLIPAISGTNSTGGGSSFQNSTAHLVQANGFSFIISSNSVSGSYTRPVVSNAIQAVGSASGSGTNTSRFAADDHAHPGVFSMGVSNLGNTVGDTRVDVGRFVLQGGNNVTLSQITAANALNTVVISGGAGGAGFSAGNSNLGNTQGDTGVVSNRLVLVGTNNITLSGSTNGGSMTISISGGAGAAGNTGYVSAGTTNASLGTLSVANSNGVTFGIDGQTLTATVKTDYLTSQSNQAAEGSNGSFTFQTLSFSNANGISFGTSAGSAITASHNALTTAANSTHTHGSPNLTGPVAVTSNSNAWSLNVNAIGNTTAQTNVTWTVGTNGLSINASGYAGIGTTGTQATFTLNSNGLQLNAGAYLTTQSAQAFSADASSTFQTLSFQNSNNVSFSNNAGGIRVTHNLAGTSTGSQGANVGISMTHNSSGLNLSITTPAQTNQTLSLAATSNTAGNSSGMTVDARSITLRGIGNVSVGFSTSAGGSSVIFSGSVPVVSNAIATVGSATNSGTNTSRFAADDHVHAGVFSLGVSNLGNTVGDTRVDVGRFVLQGGNNITMSQVTAAGALNTIIVSAGAGGGGIAASISGNSTSGGAGYSNITSGTMILAGGPNITLSQDGSRISISGNAPGAAAENNWMTLLGANVSGNSSASGSTIGLSGLNMTLSGTNGSQVVLSVPATSSLVGSSGLSISSNGSTITVYEVPASTYSNFNQITAAGTAQGNSLVSIQPFMLERPLVFSNILVPVSANVASATNTSSAWMDITLQAVIYTRNASTLSTVFSTSQSLTRFWQSNSTASVTGVLGLTASHAGTTLSPGMYWLALHISTTNTATAGANSTALTHALSVILARSIGSAANLIKNFGAGTANSQGLYPGLGILSTNATRATLAISDYTMTGTRGFLAPAAFMLQNQTF